MKTDQSLILRTQELGFTLTNDAVALKTAALEKAALIGKVDSAETQETAVQAQKALKEVLNKFEKERKQAKEPLLDAGRALDALIKKEAAELDTEGMRLARLVVDFQEQERIRVEAARRLQAQEQAELEKQKDELLSRSKSLQEQERIRDEFSARAAQVTQPIIPTKAAGQIVKEDWEITVTNPYDLAKFHPDCVNITPRLSEIKRYLSQGVNVRGIKAEKKLIATVRSGKEPTAIEA